ncbi:MAG: glycine oxidase ThiO [Candidatus Omnitrophica bacterium]|nr:glycine oxidase ThiO [Candidatus Omnitrophota bacterium]
MRFDAVVLGGGIIGCATAWELAQRGQRVALIERGAIGAEASKAAAGILAAQMDVERPGAFFELCQASKGMYRGWVCALERTSRRSVGYHRDGILYLACSRADVRRMERRRRWQTRRGLRVERWSPRDVSRREPNVQGRIRAGFFFPAESQVDNVELMEALAAACRKTGVRLWERTEAQRVLVRGRRVAGVRTTRGTIRAPVVVNGLGSWAPLSGVPIPKPVIMPARGQMLAFDAPKGLFRHVVMAEAAYGVQRRDGRLIIGSTVEFVGFDRRVTLEGMTRIVSGFRSLVRQDVFERATFREAWAGLRPCTIDRRPILGATRIAGLYVAAGHFRHGILLAPLTARLMAELILTGRASCDLSPFALDRFRR